jgi:hypothetical protein
MSRLLPPLQKKKKINNVHLENNDAVKERDGMKIIKIRQKSFKDCAMV